MKIKNKAKREFREKYFLKKPKNYYDYDRIAADGYTSDKVEKMMIRALEDDGDPLTSRDIMLFDRFRGKPKDKIIALDYDYSRESFIPMRIDVPIPQKGKRKEFLHSMWTLNKKYFSPILTPKQFSNFIVSRFNTGLLRREVESYIYTNFPEDCYGIKIQ